MMDGRSIDSLKNFETWPEFLSSVLDISPNGEALCLFADFISYGLDSLLFMVFVSSDII